MICFKLRFEIPLKQVLRLVLSILLSFFSLLQEALLTLPTQVSCLLGATLLQLEATLSGEEKKEEETEEEKVERKIKKKKKKIRKEKKLENYEGEENQKKKQKNR